MDARAIVNKNFIKPFDKSEREYIGVELEFPLINLGKKPVEKSVALGLLQHMLDNFSFRTAEKDASGAPAFIMNADGDVLSFDNSYNNFEFSMEKDKNLLAVSKRFYSLFNEVQKYLLPRGYTLCGTGTNPFKDYISSSFADFPVYGMVRSFLGKFSGGEYHSFTDFPAYLSSVQTHLDVSIDKLPRALTLFAAMDFVRALLFSNSPAFGSAEEFSETVCFRDYLWEKSGFGSLAANTGKVEGKFHTTEDVENLILSRSMFNRIRDGKYELIEPVSVGEYFSSLRSEEKDIDCYLSFQNVEVTRRGTLEVRSDCAQPICEAFCPPAFNLGILAAHEEAWEIIDSFMKRNIPEEILNSGSCNKKLRDAVIYHYQLPAAKDEVRRLLSGLVTLAENALKKRGKGEEALLSPLFSRAENLTCPAVEWKRMLKSGTPIEMVIEKYAEL